MGSGHHPRTRKERERGPRHGGKGHHDSCHDPHRRGDQRRPTPTKHPNTHHRSKHRTPCGSHKHAHRPPETTRRTEGTPTRGERTTPTEEAAGNTAARHTTMPSPPAYDPDHHEGQLTGTGRGRKHGRGTHDYGPTPPEDTRPRHRPSGRATPRPVTRPHHGL